MDRIKGSSVKPVYAVNPSRTISILDGDGSTTHDLTFGNGMLSGYSGGASHLVTLPQYLLDSAGELIEGYESAAEWAVGGAATITDDAVNFTQGTQSVNILSGGVNSYGQKVVNFNLNGKTAYMRIDIRGNTVNGEIFQFIASRADLAKYASILHKTTLANAWTRLQRYQSEWTLVSGELWSNNMIAMRHRANTAGQGFSLDNFRANVIPRTGAVMISFDDGRLTVFDNAYPSMAARHMVGTCYIVSDYVDGAGYMTSGNLQTLYAAGWDMGNHSKTHANFTTLTQAQIETELAGCKTALDGWGLTRASNHVAYPFGARDADSDAAMAAQSMLTGRLANPLLSLANKTWVMPMLEPYQIVSNEIADGSTLANVKLYIDDAVARKSIAYLFLHNVGVTGWSQANFDGLLDYIVASGLPVLTISQLWALESGPLTVTLPY